MLKFSKANSKLQKLGKVGEILPFLGNRRKVYSLDLLAGHTCPYAHECLSKVVGGKIVDGPDTKFRCYAASLEALYKAKFRSDEHNTNSIRATTTHSELVRLIQNSMPKNLGVCRIHSSGDFFNQRYFDAWIDVAKANSDRLFYAYTKNLRVWINRLGDIPPNMVLTASYGGKLDALIEYHKLRYAKVIYSLDEANSLGLEVDDNDSHAANPKTRDTSFLLLIHGVQPKKV